MLSSTVIELDLSTINPVVGLDIMFLVAHVCVVRSVRHWGLWACLARCRQSLCSVQVEFLPVLLRHWCRGSNSGYMLRDTCRGTLSVISTSFTCQWTANILPVVDAKTSLESHQLQCAFESTEVSAVPAEVVDAKTSVKGSPVAAHIFCDVGFFTSTLASYQFLIYCHFQGASPCG